jgi:nucleoside-diphosphate-sugar epimerase
MVMAADVAEILPKLAEVGGVFHLTDGHHPSFAELETALSSAMKERDPMRLPMPVAKTAAFIGDGLQKLTGLPAPFSSRTLLKMSSTLTLSDSRARQSLGWSPCRVLDHAAELVDEKWSVTSSAQTRSAILAS